MEISNEVRVDGRPIRTPMQRAAIVLAKIAYVAIAVPAIILFFALFVGIPN